MATKWLTKLELVLKTCPIVFWGHPSNFKVTWNKNCKFWPALSVSGLQLQFEFTDGFEMMHKAWCSIEEEAYYFFGSSIEFQGHTGWKIADFNPISVRLLGRSKLSNPSDLPTCLRKSPWFQSGIFWGTWFLQQTFHPLCSMNHDLWYAYIKWHPNCSSRENVYQHNLRYYSSAFDTCSVGIPTLLWTIIL